MASFPSFQWSPVVWEESRTLFFILVYKVDKLLLIWEVRVYRETGFALAVRALQFFNDRHQSGFFSLCLIGVQQTIILLFEVLMSPSVKGQLPTLSKRLGAAIDSTDKRLLVCVSILMFSKVLRESECFLTELTLEGLLSAMNVIVSLKWKLCSESFVTLWELASEYFLCFV